MVLVRTSPGKVGKLCSHLFTYSIVAYATKCDSVKEAAACDNIYHVLVHHREELLLVPRRTMLEENCWQSSAVPEAVSCFLQGG